MPSQLNLRSKLPWWNAARDISLHPRILIVADSIGAGHGSGGATWANEKADSWPTRLAALLTTAGIPARESSMCGANVQIGSSGTLAAFDPRWVTPAGWDLSSLSSLGGYALHNTTPNTSTASFTPTQPFDTIEIISAQAAGAGTLTVNIGGGTLGSIVGAGATALIKNTITCALGTHTLNMQVPGTGAFWIMAVNCYDSTAREIQIVNGSLGGATSSYCIGAGTYQVLPMISLQAPDLTILSIGPNDIANGTTLANYESQLQTVINTILLRGSLLMINWPASGTATYDNTGAAYGSIYRRLAIRNNAPLLDLENSRWPSFAIANASGMMAADAVHPSSTGYAIYAQQVFDFLFS